MTKSLVAEALSAFLITLWAGLSVWGFAALLPAGPVFALAALSGGLLVGLIFDRAASLAPSLGNPLLAIGLYLSGRLSYNMLVPTITAAIFGAVAGAGAIHLGGGLAAIGRAVGGYGEFSVFGLGPLPVLLAEAVGSFLLVIVFLAITHRRGLSRFCGLAVAALFALVAIILQPFTGGAPNPAEATGLAVWLGPVATSQLWLAWVATLAGGSLAGVTWGRMFEEGFRAPRAKT